MGAYNRYKEKYNLPEAHNFGGSYVERLPETVNYTNQIMIDDRMQTESSWFANITLVDTIENKYARDPGYIFYRTVPTSDLTKEWKSLVEEVKGN